MPLPRSRWRWPAMIQARTESWQKDMVEELSEPVPDGTDNSGISGNKIIAKARELGFHADGGRVSPDLDQMIKQVDALHY